MEGAELPEATFPGRRSSADEVIERLYEVLGIPHDQRERQYEEVARIRMTWYCYLPMSTLTDIGVVNERRPTSWLSNTSTACSDLSSKRSTQASFASSRTSYSSFSFPEQQIPGPLPAVAEEPPRYSQLPVSPLESQNAAIGFHRKLQKRFSPHTSSSSSRAPSSTPDLAENQHAVPDKVSKRRWCPWCQQTFTRPNDFSRHVTQYCCGTQFFICRNQKCQLRASQEKPANKHRKESKELDCRNLGWSKIDVHCKRRNFGCGYCAVYFDDLERYIEHFGGTCRPDKVRGHWQQSRQIRALLQQPALLEDVEAIGIQLRGVHDAYRALWWTWKSHRMESIIRKLEYGVKPKTDDRNPGIPEDRVFEFLRDLIQPSAGSQWASELVSEHNVEKQLPPVPEPMTEIDMDMEYDQHDMQMGSDPTYEYLEPLQHNNIGQPGGYQQWNPQPPIGPSNAAYQEVTLQQQLESGFTIPTPIPSAPIPDGMQYNWSNMTIDNSNEPFVDTSWISREMSYHNHTWQ